MLNSYTDWPVATNYSCRSPCVLFVGAELDDLEEASVRMVAPQVVDELDVESPGEVSHSDEDVPEELREISFQLERKDGAEI